MYFYRYGKLCLQQIFKHILHLFEGYVYTYKYINIYNKITETDSRR